jgi:hypothetical protein
VTGRRADVRRADGAWRHRLGEASAKGGVALVAVFLAVAAAVVPAVALELPGGPDVSVGNRSVSLFVRYPAMAACEAAYDSNCYRFEDGTVVGQLDPLSVLTPVFDIFRISWRGCDKVPQLGASPNVVEVYAGEGLPLAVGSGTCDDVTNALAGGRAYLAVPGVPKTIPPTPATVAGLDVAAAGPALALRAAP